MQRFASDIDAKLNFLDRQLRPQQPKNELITVRDLWSHKASWIELQASNIEEIRQQVAELRQTIDAAFERHHFRLSVFPQVKQRQ